MKRAIKSSILLSTLWLFCCASENSVSLPVAEDETTEIGNANTAQTTNVAVTGEENAYTFSVTILSPDTGCEQYADWWEVVDTEENLLYRRILGHSHVNEQPFTRSGGTISITEEQEVYIRAHMSNLGYGNTVLKGSVLTGFTTSELDVTFAATLAKQEPLPTSCAF